MHLRVPKRQNPALCFIKELAWGEETKKELHVVLCQHFHLIIQGSVCLFLVQFSGYELQPYPH